LKALKSVAVLLFAVVGSLWMAIAPSYVEAAFYDRVVRNGLIASAALLYLIAALIKAVEEW
jgi:tetrahydromethanopterin S-methyltransferase subunit C